jgi:type-F conjugative transfer system pilin assembly protein TrbC
MAKKKLLYAVISGVVAFPLFSENPPETYFEAKNCKNGCGSKILNIDEKSAENGLLVFVSFSMPAIALKQLNKFATKYDATIVIRGLYEGSFVKTKNKILEIDKNGLTLQIHPELFQKYDVKRVPTFILVKDGKEISRLSGNVDPKFALQKLEEQ